VELGRARIVREGRAITLIAWSGMVPVVERTAETLLQEGVDAEVIDLRSIVPLDVETLAQSVRKTGRAVVVQEGPLTAGFASEVAAAVSEAAFFSLEAPVARVAAPDTPFPFATSLEEYYLPNETRLLAAVRKTLES
jgi:pyruvate dehydrogenase E1 component beta subunit